MLPVYTGNPRPLYFLMEGQAEKVIKGKKFPGAATRGQASVGAMASNLGGWARTF